MKNGFMSVQISIAAIVLVFAYSTSSMALDEVKRERYREKRAREAYQRVRDLGQAPAAHPLVRPFDTNQDGIIDHDEVEAIKTYLDKKDRARGTDVKEPVRDEKEEKVEAWAERKMEHVEKAVAKKKEKKGWW